MSGTRTARSTGAFSGRRGERQKAELSFVGVAALVVLSVAACSEHSVGPARTYDDFERKSRTSAAVALSSVETVRLLAETSSDGDAWGAYTNIGLSEQEDTLAEATGDFASIQPPDHRSDDLRAQLLELLDSAGDHIATVRIAARRGDLGSLEQVAAPLADDSVALQHFLDSIKR